MTTHRTPRIAGAVLCALVPALTIQPTIVRADLTTYDAAIAADHGGGDGPLPYTATLTEPLEFDTTGGEEFDFGEITDDATFEFIVEGDPDAARNGYLAVGENTGNSLRYEQWDDTGMLGFTRSGLADYVFIAEGDEDLVLSPTEPTHVTYVWNSDDGKMDLFIDGELAGITEDATFEMPTGVGFLGANAAGGESMQGTVHRVTTYDSILSPEAIQNHARAWLGTNTDPSIQVGLEVELSLTGVVQMFELIITNSGQNNPLTISQITIAGDSAAKFSIDTELPFTIDPQGQKTVEYTFDPMGEQGMISASFVIESDDPQRDELSVELSGTVHDPRLESISEIDFGESETSVSRPLEITNSGVSQDLVIESITFMGSGADPFGDSKADAYSATNPGTIAAGAMGQSSVTFAPTSPGNYDAVMVIKSNDPISPTTEIMVTGSAPFNLATLSSYDAVIAADHGNGNGSYPYAAALLASETFDGEQAAEFDFGEIEGNSTFEFIVEGDPVEGGRDGFLAVGEDPVDNLRYEQWDDTGQLGFTRLGVADNLFVEEEDPDLLLSPEVPTHVTYVWNADDLIMQLYINGVLAGTNDGSDFAMPAGPGWIGAKNDGGAEGMLGTIHRVVTYNDLLPADVILRHAEAFTVGGGLTTFAIVQLVPNLEANAVTVTWTSSGGASYRIERTATLSEGVEWEELEDGFPAADDGEETSYTDESLEGGETTLYYRIIRE